MKKTLTQADRDALLISMSKDVTDINVDVQEIKSKRFWKGHFWSKFK